MRTGEGFLLVYSITSRNSFEEISTFHQQILRVKDQDSFPVIVVANKCDLEYERQVGMNGTDVLEEFPASHTLVHLNAHPEGRDLAKHFGCKFIETSAKQRINVDEAFSNLVREIRKYNKVSVYLFSHNIHGIHYAHLLCRNNKLEGLLLLVRLELQLVCMARRANMTRVVPGAAEVVLCCENTTSSFSLLGIDHPHRLRSYPISVLHFPR